MIQHDAADTAIDRENYRIFMVVNHIAYLGMGVHAGFVPLFYWMGSPVLALLNVLSVAAWAVAFQINRQGRHAAAITLGFGSLGAGAGEATARPCPEAQRP